MSKISYNPQDNEQSRLFANIKFLMVLQLADFIFPLISIPYVVRVLGVELYGAIAFASATIMYLVLLTNYGFNLSATRLISINRANPEQIADIYSSVMTAKIMLSVLSSILLISMIFIVEKFSQMSDLLLVTFGIVVGHMMMPIWLFQGLEKMHFITIFNVMAKFLFTTAIFLFVNDEGDYLLVPGFTSLGYVFAGVVAMGYIHQKLGIKFRRQSASRVYEQLLDGWHVFLSSISISLYTISATLILGFVSGNTAVGFFSAADKLIQAAKGVLFPITQALFPYLAKIIDDNAALGLIKLRRAAYVVLPIMTVISICLFFGAEFLITILFGHEFVSSILLLKIMSPLPLIIAASNLAGVQGLLTLGLKRAFSNVLLLGALLGVLLSLVVVPTFGAIATASVMVLVEFLITLMMSMALIKASRAKGLDIKGLRSD